MDEEQKAIFQTRYKKRGLNSLVLDRDDEGWFADFLGEIVATAESAPALLRLLASAVEEIE